MIITRITKLLAYITNFGRKAKIQSNRDIAPPSNRDIKTSKFTPLDTKAIPSGPAPDSFKCPYCRSQNFVKRGFRQKKHERVQLYQCNDCKKVFTQHLDKGKHYPLSIIFRALSMHNLGYSLETIAERLRTTPTTISNWINEYSEYMPYLRMRSYALKKFKPQDMVISETLNHKQIYQYRYHRAKCQLIIEDDFKHRRFGPVQEFLELVPSDCPHQHFTGKKSMRASESPLMFSKTQMIVRSKVNYANKLCKFVLQSVKDRRRRHQALQNFMLYNDSVTVATEVPIFIEKEDLEHLRDELGFEFHTRFRTKTSESSEPTPTPTTKLPKVITGHIDMLQIRNGQVHILDYKPKAEKTKPIEQLTLYAMALSRLTGLRLFDFKCAWFDENDYFEFYPLHVLHKPKKKRPRKKIQTPEGTYLVNQLTDKIKSLRPKTKGPSVSIK